jgi:glutamate-5-semialdehyde dehydrogenase
MKSLIEIGKQAKLAARLLARASTDQKNTALNRIAERLWQGREAILAANHIDVENAQRSGLSDAMIDRLTLTEPRLSGMASDTRSVVSLPDPVGETFEETVMPNGLKVHKQRVPLGVLAVIYESRPNVTVDVASLSLKSGDSVILRGGSETIHSNRALIAEITAAMQETGLPADAIQFIDDPARERVLELLKLNDYVDMVIPRGGAGLHRFCRENSLIPVITGGIGICHLFIDETADLEAGLEVVRNAKIQRPTVCNALDTVLVHSAVAAAVAGAFIPSLVERLSADGVTFRTDPASQQILALWPLSVVKPAGPEDFDTEWLSLVLGIKVVDGLEEAIHHISTHSTGHSDGILTGNAENARRFVEAVDSAAVYVNASTRFTDGGQLGLGAEVAISTQRLHARGPMGLRELTSYKWVIQGNYHVRP